jgi:hypothetical protein
MLLKQRLKEIFVIADSNEAKVDLATVSAIRPIFPATSCCLVMLSVDC